MIRVNFLLDGLLHRRFKAACAMEGRTQTEVLTEMIVRYVSDFEKLSGHTPKREEG